MKTEILLQKVFTEMRNSNIKINQKVSKKRETFICIKRARKKEII